MTRRFLTCPMFLNIVDALDWFEARGCINPVLWRAQDGTVRGRAEWKETNENDQSRIVR